MCVLVQRAALGYLAEEAEVKRLAKIEAACARTEVTNAASLTQLFLKFSMTNMMMTYIRVISNNTLSVRPVKILLSTSHNAART